MASELSRPDKSSSKLFAQDCADNTDRREKLIHRQAVRLFPLLGEVSKEIPIVALLTRLEAFHPIMYRKALAAIQMMS